jgi:c(7)-type cytochrome triheme protein
MQRNLKLKRKMTVVVFLAVSSMSMRFTASEPPILFHAGHVKEYGAACDTCHDRRAPEKLKPKSCGECHENRMGKVKLNAKAKAGTIRFSHALHEAAADCMDCHRTTAEDKQRDGAEMQSFNDCRDCHEKNGVRLSTRNCTLCHKKNLRTVRPKSHRTDWRTRHGWQSAWAGMSGHGSDCYLCHSRVSCKNCHRTQKPKNHTALFRMRTHGRIASLDRQRCRTCHETGACINCHRNSAPMTHRGAWSRVHGISATVNGDRCRVCHSPGFGAAPACAACHRGPQ